VCSLPKYLHLPFFSFFNASAPPAIYTLSLHDALPICPGPCHYFLCGSDFAVAHRQRDTGGLEPVCAVLIGVERGHDLYLSAHDRSEEHTSELQSRFDIVCRLLLEKKKIQIT